MIYLEIHKIYSNRVVSNEKQGIKNWPSQYYDNLKSMYV